jgi:hypothetical protein
MHRLNEIFDVTDAEVALIQKQSALLLQRKEDGFSGEMKSAGSLIENYIKGLLQNHLPHGYRLCSGYIATHETIGDKENLIQHDIIIVDARVPSIYVFGVSDIEVVPAEAVCGIVEVKRTLTKRSIESAVAHLRRTKEILDRYEGGIKSKVNSTNNAVGPTLSVATSSPMYAIIGLSASEEIIGDDFSNTIIFPAIIDFLDFLWSPLGPYLAGAHLIDPQSQRAVSTSPTRKWDGYEPSYFIEGKFDQSRSGQSYRIAIASFRTWINNSAAAPMTPERNLKYFGML